MYFGYFLLHSLQLKSSIHNYASSRGVLTAISALKWKEVVFTNALEDNRLKELAKIRPGINFTLASTNSSSFWAYWTMFAEGDYSSAKCSLQLDGTLLEYFFLGSKQLNEIDTATQWNSLIEKKANILKNNFELTSEPSTNYKFELDVALSSVRITSHISRCLQNLSLMKVGEASIKIDNSPVTLTDFVVQAMIIDRISKIFPNDYFIAEEDSTLIKSDLSLENDIIATLELCTNEKWDSSRLYQILDKGNYQGHTNQTTILTDTDETQQQQSRRVWVLDPIDGTKGFIKGKHYCIALALLVDHQPVLSVLGTPNLSYQKILQSSSETSKETIIAIEPLQHSQDGNTIFCSPDTGCIFFATLGQGAYLQSLTMPVESGYETSTSLTHDISTATICETAELNDSNTRSSMYKLKFPSINFLRMHGQGKYCLVGAGIADANLRIPRKGYQEKIWDHVPGALFVKEAGGIVTDIVGRELDYSQGRFLAKDVVGIIACNNAKLHQQLLDVISIARKHP